MRIILKTRVKGNYLEIMKRFDRHLFESLAPKFPSMRIIRFDGSESGDTVHIRFGFPMCIDWKSKIVDHGSDENRAFFVDEGVKLPPGITSWHHEHIVERVSDNESRIIDDITYTGFNRLFTLLAYPFFVMGFYPRKKIYRTYFGK